MAMNYKSIESKIPARTSVRVKGITSFMRTERPIEGEELARANQYTKFPSKDPYRKATIEITTANPQDAFIYDKNNEGETYLAAYLASRVYESKKDANAGKKFLSVISKGKQVYVYKKDAQGKLHQVNLNGNELAPGLEVELEITAFQTQYGGGTGLNAVVITSPEIKVFEGARGVKGYELADDVITMPARTNHVVDDVATAEGVADETPVADTASGAVEVDPDPIGSTSAPSNENFDQLLAKFKAGN